MNKRQIKENEVKRRLLLGRKVMTNLDSIFKSKDITLPSSQGYGFSCGHVWMWVGLWRRLSAKDLILLNCGVGEDSWESFGQQGDPTVVNPKGNQPWIFIGRTDAGAETPILWPPDAKSQLIGKHTDAGKDWGQEEKGVTEDEMVGRHHQLNGHEFEKSLGDSEGQWSLVCCSPWGCKESDTT